MAQGRVNNSSADEDPGNVPTHAEDGQVVNISETIEIPIGEEMVLVQSVEPGLLDYLVALLIQGCLELGEGQRTTIKRNDNQSHPMIFNCLQVNMLIIFGPLQTSPYKGNQYQFLRIPCTCYIIMFDVLLQCV